MLFIRDRERWLKMQTVKPVGVELGAVDIHLSEDDCESFFVLTRRGEEP